MSTQTPAHLPPRSYGVTLVLAFFLGALGAHWFYLGRTGLGRLRLVFLAATIALAFGALVAVADTSYDISYGYRGTAAGWLLLALWAAAAAHAVWSLVDLVLVATRRVRDGEGRRLA